MNKPLSRENIISKIAGLAQLSLEELRTLWRELYEKEPPAFNRNFLEARLAYRIQEIAYGGISDETLQRLKNLNQKKEADKFNKEAFKPPIGTVLVREFQGVEHRVHVLHDGFDYQGVKYRSLTAVAYKITGSSWSGLRFFGLRNDRTKS